MEKASTGADVNFSIIRSNAAWQAVDATVFVARDYNLCVWGLGLLSTDHLKV